ncbi:MAG: RelA/SpoT domain-containing protein [Bacteroidales bacterium]|nr:RelA/SpoT domain-containing protein [Bacteroidales bacterium]
MKYSRNQLNKAGQIVVADDDVFKFAEATTLIDDWRAMHQPVLDKMSAQVMQILTANSIPIAFSSKRLKRMVSIVNKLMHNPTMGLGGIQDIGGARFAFEDVPTLMVASRLLQNTSLEGFELKSHYDYVKQPKESGYRSIHFVYKYHSDDDYDGMLVELQIRTRLQHDWATAVETAELISQSPLKASVGDEHWQDYFKLVSAIFARQEKQPTAERFAHFTEADFCRQYDLTEKEHKFTEQLSSLVGAVQMASEHSFSKGYVVVHIDFENHVSRLRHFNADEIEAANELYSKVESGITNKSGAVVLVSVSDMNELREAYPSYFLNANEFIFALLQFHKSCRTAGYVS